MAHHMLYTAMQEYPCYEGYLWAPFDTFLNVPRLEQFDLNTFWYHSPFAKYVPNKALGNEEENQDPKRHPDPARISPDPSLNLTDGWRGWGPDWWWGYVSPVSWAERSAHRGLAILTSGSPNVCRPSYVLPRSSDNGSLRTSMERRASSEDLSIHYTSPGAIVSG